MDPILPVRPNIAFPGDASQPRAGRSGRATRLPGRWFGCVVAGLLCAAAPVAAADLGSVDGFQIRLDTTLRGSIGVRLKGQNPAIVNNANGDDGDRAFRRGLTSERMDFTSQLDVARGDFGFNLSVDGWYNAAYQGHDANRSSATFNPVSVPVNSFPMGVRRLMGGTVELGNAYVHDRVEIAGIPVTVRIGRQTLLWGESLFSRRTALRPPRLRSTSSSRSVSRYWKAGNSSCR